MDKLLVILGPTSTGKTDLALSLAKKFNGELISCDSRQVYIGLDLGTGKMPGRNVSVEKKKGFWILDGIKIWMYDVASPKTQFDVSKYLLKVKKVLGGIERKGKLPIIVGGSGLYFKGLLYGFSNLGIPMDKKLRKNLEKLSLDELQKRLQNLSVKSWVGLNPSDQKNPRRLIRAIEIATVTPKKRVKQLELKTKNFNLLKIGLTAPRDILYKRIDERVEKRIKQGMVEEAEQLLVEGVSLKKMRHLGLEYGVLADFLENKISKDNLVKIIQGKIHRYLRRQITWFKKEKEINWIDITEKNYMIRVENLVAEWYYQTNAPQN